MKQAIRKYNKGFTLVELLVVLSIIAILSVIGLTLFNGAQQNARDARRKADVDAIASALESKRQPGAVVYLPVAATDFSSGTIPADNTTAQYCIRLYTDIDTVKTEALPTLTATSWGVPGASTVCPADAAAGTSTIWYPATATAGTGGFQPLAPPAVVPFSDASGNANKKSWKICARLENPSAPAGSGFAAGTYCKFSAQ